VRSKGSGVSLRRMASSASAAGAMALALAVSGSASGKPAESRDAVGLTGRFLVASASMTDPRFSRAVILVVRHDASGAVGLVLNRPFQDVPIALLLSRLGLAHDGIAGSMRIHYGGPVDPGRVFVLHTAEYRGEGTEVISGGIALTTHPDVLRAIGTGAGPRRALLFLSYSGWGPGQLEREIREGAWFAVPANAALAFDDDYDTKWQRAMALRATDL
jgi:putative transcriptional regulator